MAKVVQQTITPWKVTRMKRSISTARAAMVLALVMALSAPAAGQDPPQPDKTGADPEVERLYREGVKAAGRKQWEQARQVFLEAWKRKPHFQIAANLGRAELRAGKPRDAVEHIEYFLREAPADVSQQDRTEAQSLLAEARAQIGTLALTVEPEGADVLLDGAPVGTLPPTREVLVDPGHRVLEARREGYRPARQEVDVAPGTRATVTLRLEREKPLSLPPRSPPPAPPPEGGGRSPALIGVGIGTAVAAAGAGAVLVVLAMGKASDQDDLGDPNGNFPPGDPTRSQWTELEQSRADLLSAAAWSFIGAGVIGGATAVYALTGKAPAAALQKTGQIRVYPAGTGIEVSGRW
jgi:hypothetical protein